jgi:2-polyprenyl-6-methoxyphenol hydroxylase-like FAD-dependent oxidoreductase
VRTVVIGGGPGGLFAARLIALARPGDEVRVYERASPDAGTGFGLVFSGRALSTVAVADPETAGLVRRAGVHWTDLELRPPGGKVRYGNHAFTALPRRALLGLLRDQAVRAGVRLTFGSAVTPAEVDADVVVAADGAGSRTRDAGAFGTTVTPGRARYIWFSTPARFDAMTFPFVRTEFGAVAAHAHPYGDGVSSFLVETDAATVDAAGVIDPEHARAWLAEVFADHLGGHPLVPNGSHWSRFRVVVNERWSDGNVVLLGDAAHTAHFSIGSGTAMAMRDAIALAEALRTDPLTAFAGYERARRDSVTRAQANAGLSMRWWETFGQRLHLPAEAFAAQYLTRTGVVLTAPAPVSERKARQDA